MASRRKVAIFDVDGTIFRSSLLIELTDALVQEGVFPARVRAAYDHAYTQWLNRKDSYERYIEAVVKAFMRHIKGVSYLDFLRVGKKVAAFHKHRVYRYTRDLIHQLKRKGYYILAISHSPKEILDEFCKEYAFDKVYGWLYAIGPHGRYTGETLFLGEILDKAKIVRRAVQKENLTLRGSIGVGDTENDIRFLKLVSQPICFNPNKKLYSYARRVGWKIVVERKDVVYEFPPR